MALSAFGVEDDRLSKADNKDRGVAAAAGAAGGLAGYSGQKALSWRGHEKRNLRVAEDWMEQHREKVKAGSPYAENYQHAAQEFLEHAQQSRKLKHIHGGIAGLAGTGALAGATVAGVRARRRKRGL